MRSSESERTSARDEPYSYHHFFPSKRWRTEERRQHLTAGARAFSARHLSCFLPLVQLGPCVAGTEERRSGRPVEERFQSGPRDQKYGWCQKAARERPCRRDFDAFLVRFAAIPTVLSLLVNLGRFTDDPVAGRARNLGSDLLKQLPRATEQVLRFLRKHPTGRAKIVSIVFLGPGVILPKPRVKLVGLLVQGLGTFPIAAAVAQQRRFLHFVEEPPHLLSRFPKRSAPARHFDATQLIRDDRGKLVVQRKLKVAAVMACEELDDGRNH
eukprot:scaffold556_cov221-Pinguiococcus_pyrenoidosus.AAC.15